MAWEPQEPPQPGNNKKLVTRGKIQDKNKNHFLAQNVGNTNFHTFCRDDNYFERRDTNIHEHKPTQSQNDHKQHNQTLKLSKLPSSNLSLASISKAIKKGKQKLTGHSGQRRDKTSDSQSTAYGSAESESSSPSPSTSPSSSRSGSVSSSDDLSAGSSFGSLPGTLDQEKEIENELFFKRLFKTVDLHHRTQKLKSSIKSGANSHSKWQTFTLGKTLFIELGHSTLGSMSRHDVVDLIDDAEKDSSIFKLVFYFNKNRSDVKNLNAVFRLMDFRNVIGEGLLEKNEADVQSVGYFELNEFNNYWVYEADGGGDDEGSDVFSDEGEDFFE